MLLYTLILLFKALYGYNDMDVRYSAESTREEHKKQQKNMSNTRHANLIVLEVII